MNKKPSFLSEYQSQSLAAMGVDLFLYDTTDTAVSETPRRDTTSLGSLSSLRDKVGLVRSHATPELSASQKSDTPVHVEGLKKNTVDVGINSTAQPRKSLNNVVAVLFEILSPLEKDIQNVLEQAGLSIEFLPSIAPDELSEAYCDIAMTISRGEVFDLASDRLTLSRKTQIDAAQKRLLWKTIQSLYQ